MTTTPAGLRVAPTRVRARATDVTPPPSSSGSWPTVRMRPSMPRRPPAGGRTVSRPAPKVTMPEAIASSRGEAADDEGCALGDVRLAAVGRPEVHRRGVIEEEPGGQLAIRHVLADLRSRRSGPSRSSRSGGRRRPARTGGCGPVRRRSRGRDRGDRRSSGRRRGGPWTVRAGGPAARRSGPGPGRAAVRSPAAEPAEVGRRPGE